MRKLILLFLLFTASAFGQVWKPQSVATTVEIFFRDTTSNNGKTGLAATAITCDLTKPSNTTASTKTTFTGTASGGTHDILEVGHGKYNVELPAADVDTIGSGYIECQATGAFDSGKVTFNVISAASWAVNFVGDISDNSTIAAAVKALLDAAYATNWGYLDQPNSAGTTSNPNLNPNFTTGTAQAGTATTITLAAGESAMDNVFKNSYIVIKSGTGVNQWALITAYNGTTKVATITCAQTVNGSWLVTPDATSVYSIFAKGR